MPSCALLLAVMLHAQGRDTLAVYRNDSAGFELTIPSGWVQMPDTVLQAGIRAMIQHGADPNQVAFVTAFSRAPVRDWHAYPYVMIQLQSFGAGDSVPPPHVLDSLVAFLNEAAPPTGSDLIAHPPRRVTARVDSSGEVATMDMGPTRLTDGKAVQGYAAFKVGRRGIVSVNVYGIAADSLATRTIRDRFLAGFRTTRPRPR